MAQRFIVTAHTPEIYEAIKAQLIALYTLNKEAFEFNIEPVKEKGTTGKRGGGGNPGARVYYATLGLPMNAKAREEAIKENLKNFEGKLKGFVYQAIVKADAEGHKITKPEIMEECKITTASTAEREIGDLCRMKLVNSYPINFNEERPEAGQ